LPPGRFPPHWVKVKNPNAPSAEGAATFDKVKESKPPAVMARRFPELFALSHRCSTLATSRSFRRQNCKLAPDWRKKSNPWNPSPASRRFAARSLSANEHLKNDHGKLERACDKTISAVLVSRGAMRFK
jgi:hypothetical protein